MNSIHLATEIFDFAFELRVMRPSRQTPKLSLLLTPAQEGKRDERSQATGQTERGARPATAGHRASAAGASRRIGRARRSCLRPDAESVERYDRSQTGGRDLLCRC